MPFIPPEWGQTGKPGTSSLQELGLVEAIDQLVGLGSMGSIDPSSMVNPMAGPFGKIIAGAGIPPLTVARAVKSIPRFLRRLLTKSEDIPIVKQENPFYEAFYKHRPGGFYGGAIEEGPMIGMSEQALGGTGKRGFKILRHELEHGLQDVHPASPGTQFKLRSESPYRARGMYTKKEWLDELPAIGAEEAVQPIWGGDPLSRTPSRAEFGELYRDILRRSNRELGKKVKAKGKLRRPR